MSVNNSSTITFESWFIPLDIIGIVCLVLAILLGTFIIIVIIENKECHTVPMLLTGNVYLTALLSAIAHLIIAFYTFSNDLKQIDSQTISCIIIGYMTYPMGMLHNYSYLLSALYRYIRIVYPTRLSWQSARIQIFLISLSWLLGFLLPIVVLLKGDVIYDVDNQICQVPQQFSFSILYLMFLVYLIPVNLVIFIYIKLVSYVRQISQHVTPANVLLHAQRDLYMVRQIVTLVHILVLHGLPFAIGILLAFAGIIIKYRFRIAFISANITPALIMIVLLIFTDPLKKSIKKIIVCRKNTVVPIVA